ncbi:MULTISPECIES: CS1 type fimbrial major subunit [Pseudomonas]|uniref:CS1 type fimbrial major subunit n=1 Tax=Pseudomonas TaxID=286 RepID=UPI001D07ABFF|nr:MULTISPECIES: CS1 type fimbrial major subunit [Pseudomonas]UDI91891.1 fimbrial assembly protein [Pseudomonas sp. IAC-BECa141]UIN55404.1 fimbrial protein [Pseudomonas kribbensis]
MFKKIAITASLAALALSSSVTFAAGEARHSISLIAHVPTNGFYVVPTDTDLVNKDQDMSYQPSTGKMREINGFFDVRNNNGSVHASLESVPQLIYGSETIPLEVSFNNKVLTLTPQMVVGESESDVNYRAPIKIRATGSSFPSGDYTGVVALTFDAVPPIAAL